jgi:hypothetical protein
VTTHYSAAEIGFLIAATERVCDLAERASPAIAVVRSRQPEGVTHETSFSERTDETVATVRANGNGSILPDPLQKAAAELAAASGLSLNQFIAAAVAEKVGAVESMPDSPLVAAVRRPYGSMAATNGEILEDGLANGDPEARYWSRPKVSRPNVRRAAIIKKRSAKFPYRMP